MVYWEGTKRYSVTVSYTAATERKLYSGNREEPERK
jgi:hypothetical protein